MPMRAATLLAQRVVVGGDAQPLSSPEPALESYVQPRKTDHLAVRIVRRGEPQTLEYQLR